MTDGSKYGCTTTAPRFLLTFGSALLSSHEIKLNFFNGLEISLH